MKKVGRLARDPEKEKRIIDESMAEFAAHGYHQTRIEDIAEKAAVSKGLVFKYYQSKAHLYFVVLKEAAARVMAVADLHVWQDSEDLVAMVVNATQYKIKLQLTYQVEFKVLLDAYVRIKQLPEEAREFMQKGLMNNLDLRNQLSMPILDRLKLKPGVRKEDVYEMLTMLEDSYATKIQQYLLAHPKMDRVEEMDELIETLARYLRIFEHGFMAE